MIRALALVLILYVIALHTSMAGMEIFGWLSVTMAVGIKLQRRERFKTHGMLWPLLLFVASVVVSLLISAPLKPLGDQIGVMRFAVLLLGLTWALELVWSRQFEERLIRTWLILLAVTGLYALLQAMTGVDLIPRSRQVLFAQGELWKATGFFSFSLTFAYMCGLSLIAIARPGMNSVNKKLAYAACLFGVMGVIVSFSRGAWLALIICGFIYIVFRRRKLIFPFLAAVVIAAVALSALEPTFARKISGILQFKIDTSVGARLSIWRSYWAMFLDQPWFGVGLFQGDKLLPIYYQRLGINSAFYSHAHGNFLQVLAGAGIIGLAGYLWMIFVPLRNAWRIRNVQFWGWSLFLAQIFLHLGGLTELNFFDGEVSHFLMFVWALALFRSSEEKVQVD